MSGIVKLAHVRTRDKFNRPLFTFTYETHSHHIEWKAYEVMGECSTGALLYGDLQGPGDLATAEPYAHGDLKWDGCVNMYFDEQERCALHFCGPEKEPKLAALMRGVYALGPAMESWDHEPNEGATDE